MIPMKPTAIFMILIGVTLVESTIQEILGHDVQSIQSAIFAVVFALLVIAYKK
jgi:uncharacterized membrane protein YcaP (DUF421 family)